jgi:hypothetical protein
MIERHPVRAGVVVSGTMYLVAGKKEHWVDR